LITSKSCKYFNFWLLC